MYNVYLISNSQGHYKIGFTRRNVNDRIRELKTGNSEEIQLISEYSSDWGTKIEAALHRKYKKKKINREWFELNEYEVENFLLDCHKIHEGLEYLSRENNWVKEKGFR